MRIFDSERLVFIVLVERTLKKTEMLDHLQSQRNTKKPRPL